MAMVGVDSGSLHRLTHSLSRLAWSWVGGRLEPFCVVLQQSQNLDDTGHLSLTTDKITRLFSDVLNSVTFQFHVTGNGFQHIGSKWLSTHRFNMSKKSDKLLAYVR